MKITNFTERGEEYEYLSLSPPSRLGNPIDIMQIRSTMNDKHQTSITSANVIFFKLQLSFYIRVYLRLKLCSHRIHRCRRNCFGKRSTNKEEEGERGMTWFKYDPWTERKCTLLASKFAMSLIIDRGHRGSRSSSSLRDRWCNVNRVRV